MTGRLLLFRSALSIEYAQADRLQIYPDIFDAEVTSYKFVISPVKTGLILKRQCCLCHLYRLWCKCISPSKVEILLTFHPSLLALSRFCENLLLFSALLFDSIGFNQINDEIFRWLVFHRICFPKSKLKTSSYLYRYH
jgi:hypothetical protein